MNVHLFSCAEKMLLSYSSSFAFAPARRYINFDGDKRERRIASDGQILAKYDVGLLKALVVLDEREGEIILFTGPRYATIYSEKISQATSGECLLFYSQFSLDLVKSPAECYDICSLVGDEDYRGHDFGEVFGCFLSIYAWRGG